MAPLVSMLGTGLLAGKAVNLLKSNRGASGVVEDPNKPGSEEVEDFLGPTNAEKAAASAEAEAKSKWEEAQASMKVKAQAAARRKERGKNYFNLDPFGNVAETGANTNIYSQSRASALFGVEGSAKRMPKVSQLLSAGAR